MANILIEYSDYNVTTKDIIKLIDYISHNNEDKVNYLAKRSINITYKDLLWSNIIFSVRSFNFLSSTISSFCEKTNRIFIECIDDNLFNLYRNDIYMRVRQNALKICIENSNIIQTSGVELAEIIQKNCGTKHYYICNSFRDEKEIYVGEKCKNENIFKIVYYCNDGTTKNFDEIVLPILDRLPKELNKNIEVYLMGIQSINYKNKDTCKVIYVPHMPVEQFREYLRKQNFDIGIAPLIDDIEFSRCKYFNKFIEYTTEGILGVYSNCLPYTRIVKNGENGFLCNNCADDWIKTIKYIRNNNEKADKCLINAQELLREKFSYSNCANVLIKNVPEILNTNFTKEKNKKYKYILLIRKFEFRIFVILERINTFFIWVIRYGPKATFLRVRRFILEK